MDTNDDVIHEELVKLQDKWSEALAITRASIPDDDYLFKLISIKVGFSKNRRFQAVSKFEVADGTYSGKEILKFDGLVDEVSLGFFKGYCEILGIEITENMSELPDILNEFVEQFSGLITATVKTKGEYTNIYVKGVVETESSEEAEEKEEQEHRPASKKPIVKPKQKPTGKKTGR